MADLESLGVENPDEEAPARGLIGTVVRGAGLAGSGYALAQILNLGVYVVLARLLDPEDFGTFAAATVLLGFALLVTESGLTSAVVQRRDRLDEAAATATVATFVNGIVLSLVALATAPLLGLFFDASEVTQVAAAMSGILFVRVLSSVPDALLQRNFSFLRRVAIEPLSVIVFGTVSIIAASNGMGVWALVLGQYASTVMDVILSWGFARYKPKLHLASFAMWRELVGYGRHIFVATAILQAGQQSDALIIGRLINTPALGQFRYGFRLASTPFQALLAAAAYVLFPAFSRIADDAARFYPAFLRSLRWMSILALPGGLLLLPLGESLAVVLFGDVWRSAGYVAAAMGLFTGAGMISSVASEALKAAGRPEQLTKMHAVSAGATAALMLVGATIGLLEAAAGVSIGAAIGAVYALVLVERAMGISMRSCAAEIVPSLIAASVMAATMFPVARWVDAESYAAIPALLLIGLQALVCLGIFGLVLRLISPGSFAELRWAKDSILERVRSRRRAAAPPA